MKKAASIFLKSRKFISPWFNNECVATPVGLPKNILQCTRSRLIVQCWWKTKKISINILIAKGWDWTPSASPWLRLWVRPIKLPPFSLQKATTFMWYPTIFTKNQRYLTSEDVLAPPYLTVPCKLLVWIRHWSLRNIIQWLPIYDAFSYYFTCYQKFPYIQLV